jgi:hypothetical protein
MIENRNNRILQLVKNIGPASSREVFENLEEEFNNKKTRPGLYQNLIAGSPKHQAIRGGPEKTKNRKRLRTGKD